MGDTIEPGRITPDGRARPRDFDARRFMVETGILLASSLELDETLENITRLAVEHVADWCSVNLFEPDGSIRRAAIAHRDPSKLALARDLTDSYPNDPSQPTGVAEVQRTGNSMLMHDISDDDLRGSATGEKHYEALRAAELRSAMIVPLVSRGAAFGTITFASNIAGEYDEGDLRLMEQFGRQAGLAVDNARLYMAARRELEERKTAEEQRGRAAEEVRILYEAGRALGDTLDADQIYDTMHTLVNSTMDCDGLLVSAVGDDDLIRCSYAWVEGSKLDPSGLPPVPLNRDGLGMQSKVIMTGEPILFLDVEERIQKKQGTYYHVQSDGSVQDAPSESTPTTKSILMVPITLDGRVRGVVQVMSHRHGAYTHDDLRVLEGLVLQMGAASRNAALYQQAQAEIEVRRRAEDRYRSLVAAVTSVVWSADSKRRFIVPQPSWEEFTGQDWEEHRGEGWLEAIHPDDRELTRAAWANAIQSRRPFQSEYRLWHVETDRYRHVVSRGVPLRNPDGEVTEWVGTVADVHESRVSQERTAFLLALNDRIREIIDPDELLGEVVAALGARLRADRCWYAETNFDEGWVEIRQEYYRDGPAVAGKYPLEASESPVIGQLMKGSVVSISDVVKDELTNERADTYASMSVGAYISVPVLRAGVMEGVLTISTTTPRLWSPEEVELCEDVAERSWLAVQNARAKAEIVALNTELERRVRERTAQLEAANVEMEGFTYTVSHDLRAPLRAIVSSSMIVLEDYGDQVAPEMRELLIRQAGAAKQLGILVDDLLKLSRLSRLELTKRRLDLTTMARDLARELVADAGGEAEFNIAEGLTAHGDPQLLRLALQNLFENSIKFGKPGQRVAVEMGHVTLDGEAAFYVRDNGIGFDQQYERKIFEPFERLHREADYPGTGVGLANVKRVVERHGGAIWAESKENDGATFYFTL